MSTVIDTVFQIKQKQGTTKGYRVLSKGASEIVLSKCNWILSSDGQLVISLYFLNHGSMSILLYILAANLNTRQKYKFIGTQVPSFQLIRKLRV